MEHVGKFLMVFEKVSNVWLIEKMTLLMVENALAIQQSLKDRYTSRERHPRMVWVIGREHPQDLPIIWYTVGWFKL